jgi:hypothetical protein
LLNTVAFPHRFIRLAILSMAKSDGSLAYLPFHVGKVLVGTGGWLLAAFVPEHGPRHPAILWLIFALAASIAPIGLIAFRRYIRVPEAGRQDENWRQIRHEPRATVFCCRHESLLEAFPCAICKKSVCTYICCVINSTGSKG